FLGLDEDRAALLEIADDVLVVDDLMADVYGPLVMRERELDRLHGALDAGAEAAGRGEQDATDHRSIVPSRGTAGTARRKTAPDKWQWEEPAARGGRRRGPFPSCSPRARPGNTRRGSHRPVPGSYLLLPVL